MKRGRLGGDVDDLVHEGLTDGLVRALGVVRDVLVDDGLAAGFLVEGLLFLVLRDKLRGQLHDWVLDAGARKVLDPSLGGCGRRIVEAAVGARALILQAEGHGVVALAAALVASGLPVGALADYAVALRVGGGDQAGLGWPAHVGVHCASRSCEIGIKLFIILELDWRARAHIAHIRGRGHHIGFGGRARWLARHLV